MKDLFSTPTTPKREQVATLPCDGDGHLCFSLLLLCFIPGSIVRIQLPNFLTHDWVEFRPRPYLNVILGPNGTSTRSTACAICLGLNWPPSILGRANEISSVSKSSTLTLNGQSCTGKEITNRMAKLNVHVGNLCSFLPQDKKRNVPRGMFHLTNWHDTLITAGKELKSIQHIAVLEVLIPVNEYHEAKEPYQRAKDHQRELHSQVRKLKDRNAHAKLDPAYEKEREKKKTASHQKFQQMKSKWGENDKLERDAEVSNGPRGSAHNEKWQRELDNPPKLEDLEDINAEMRKVNREHSQTTTRMEDLQERQKKNVDSSAGQQANISGALNQLKNLGGERLRKLEKLPGWDRDISNAVVWLRNHQHKFKMEVFEPHMMCCTVPDRRYTDAIEACFNQDQLKILVTQYEEDYVALNSYLNYSEQAGLRKDARINVWFRPKVDLSPPPMNEAMAIGLDASKVDVNAAMEAVSRDGVGAEFIVGRVMNTVSRSRYGKRAATNMTRDLHLARNLVSSTIDPEIKKKLDQTIQEAMQALEVINGGANNLAAGEREIRAEEALFKKTFDALEAQKKVVKNQKKHLATLAAKIETNKNKLRDLENAPSVEDERAKLRLFEISKKRVRINALETLCQEKDEKYQRALTEFEEADQMFVATKADAKNTRDISLELVRVMDEEFQQQDGNGIEALTEILEDREKSTCRVEREIKNARVGGIGCAGEIRISPPDDYDKWAIDILVKFRDNEKLQLLPGQRQSGG
ncbi:hypothetical protein CY34DRAFT_812613, partial [Suillus luteus UH-Slu-Lm8-n1]